MATPVSRLFNGTSDWIQLPFSLGQIGLDIQSFTIGLWIQSGDTSGVDKALVSAEAASSGAASNVSLGFYWNKDELLVKYYWRAPGSPGGAGTFEEKTVPFASPLNTPLFVAIIAEGDVPEPGATPTFRFYAGLTPDTIVQVGTAQVASGSIKANTRNFSLGVRTTGSTQTADGSYFSGYMQRIGYFNEEALTLTQLKHFAATSTPHLPAEFATWGIPQGQVFEIWGENPENDHSLNFWQTISITGTSVEAPIAPQTPWSHKQTLGAAQNIDAMVQLDDGSVLASLRKTNVDPIEIWKSNDNGNTWTLADTLALPLESLEVFVDLGGGTVVGVGFAGTEPAEVWKSTDYGDTWAFASNLDTDVNYIWTLLNLGSNELLAGTNRLGDVFRSTDGGDSWTMLSSINTTSNDVHALIDLGGGVLLAGTGISEIFRSTDSGATWTATAYSVLTPGSPGGVVMRSMGTGVVLAGTSFGDLYYSDDSGATWARTLDGAGVFINFYHQTPEYTFIAFGTCVFASTRKYHFVFGSTDGGQTWTRELVNTRGVTQSVANVLLANDTYLFGADVGFFVEEQAIYALDLFAIAECVISQIPSIRDTSQRRTFIFTGKIELCAPHIGACCSAVVVQAPSQGRTESANPPPGITTPDQGRTIPYVEETPPTVGTAHVTQIQKFVEYHLPSSTPGTCSLRVRIRILRVSDLVQVFELDQYKSLQYSKRWTELNDFSLIMSADSEQGIRMRQLGIVPSNGKYICNIVIDELSDFAGFIDHINIHITNRGEHIWTLQGTGCDRILADRILLPPVGFSSDSYEGPAESIMKAIVDRHLVNPITTGIPNINDAERLALQLVIAPDIGTGEIVKLEGRFQKVHEALLQISKSSDDIGFDVAVLENNLVFEVSEGMDRSASAVLAVELDNMADFVYDKDGTQFASHMIMGGSGKADVRILTATSTETSTRTNIERREVFQDSRDLLTLEALSDKGKSLLQDKGQVDTFGGRILLGSRPCYRRDYQVGDFITIKSFLYDISQVVRVMEAKVVVEGGRLEQCDLTFIKPPKRFIETLKTLPLVTATARN